jgi:hypothetical protein
MGSFSGQPLAYTGNPAPPSGVMIYNDFAFTWGAFDGSFTVQLYSEGNGLFAQRKSTTAQTYRIYNTWTDASNYERGAVGWVSNVFDIGTAAAGTGTLRAMTLTASSISTTVDLKIFSGTAIPANGTTGSGFKFSSTANFGVFFGSSTPSLSAAKGSLYLRSDGSGATDRAYINTDGGTTWTNLVTGG